MSLKLGKASLQIWIAWRLFLFGVPDPYVGSKLVRWDSVTSIYSFLTEKRFPRYKSTSTQLTKDKQSNLKRSTLLRFVITNVHRIEPPYQVVNSTNQPAKWINIRNQTAIKPINCSLESVFIVTKWLTERHCTAIKEFFNFFFCLIFYFILTVKLLLG